LKAPFTTNLDTTACQCNNVSRRGVFSASRPPTNEKELSTIYFEGSRAMYANPPCPRAFMTSDGTYDIISLQETVMLFIALRKDNICFDSAQLEDPWWSYLFSLAAITINRRSEATRQPSYPPLKVISIQLKDPFN
jgi:hypothetical protein